MSSLSVFARWRPLDKDEEVKCEITRITSKNNCTLHSISIKSTEKHYRSAAAFTTVFETSDDNAIVFSEAVAPALPKVLHGGSCNFFAYGHSGSGKTHTIIGYEHEDKEPLGLCLAAARSLFHEIEILNEGRTEDQLGISLSMFELRQKSAYDLLSNRTECTVREGYDGKTHIRGPTETLNNGIVRVRPIVQHPCWSFESLLSKFKAGIKMRQVGSSSIHDQSSRTHAVLELEIITAELMRARDAVIERQAELVPVGKRATDITISEGLASFIRTPDGGWAENPDRPQNQALIDAAEAEKAKFEARVIEAEAAVVAIIGNDRSPVCLGGKLVFVDLAGAEYQNKPAALGKQTPREQQEGRQINTDLLALKEVIRASSMNQSRIPFRSSPLTMVLREHFLGSKDGLSAMIVTLNPGQEHYAASLNSLKYGSLVGVAGS